MLFALALDRLDAGTPPADARRPSCRNCGAVTTGRLNLLLTDGEQLHGTRGGNSLFASRSTIVSEPLDTAAAGARSPTTRVVRHSRERATSRCRRSVTGRRSRSTCTSRPTTRRARSSRRPRRPHRDARSRSRRSGSTTTVGSELFDEITRLPEYYPTRTERAILVAHAPRRRRAHAGRHARRAGLGHVGEDPHPARRVRATRDARSGSCRST